MENLFTYLSDTSLSYVNISQDCESGSQSKSVIPLWFFSFIPVEGREKIK